MKNRRTLLNHKRDRRKFSKLLRRVAVYLDLSNDTYTKCQEERIDLESTTTEKSVT